MKIGLIDNSPKELVKRDQFRHSLLGHLAPLDFYLRGTVKDKVRSTQVRTRDEN